MGCIHIYTGDGKGKTTAAMGLVLRAVGSGKKALIVQFLKGGTTGELSSLSLLNVPVLRNSRQYGFFHTLGEAERQALMEEHNAMLETVRHTLRKNVYDLVVLDELIGAYHLGAVNRFAVKSLVNSAPYSAELVLTGRNAPEWMTERADYVTVMAKQKHPFDRGVPARQGVEF